MAAGCPQQVRNEVAWENLPFWFGIKNMLTTAVADSFSVAILGATVDAASKAPRPLRRAAANGFRSVTRRLIVFRCGRPQTFDVASVVNASRSALNRGFSFFNQNRSICSSMMRSTRGSSSKLPSRVPRLSGRRLEAQRVLRTAQLRETTLSVEFRVAKGRRRLRR
jgi:hypothetical protein